jgi:superfamily I DNA/RNA helicase
VFAWFASGTGNLVVRARAGTGKTTTIIEAVKHAPEKRILLAAFNKSIATELTERIVGCSDRAEALTLHSLGFSMVRNAWRGVRVDNRRGVLLAREVIKASEPDALAELVAKLASRCKAACPFPSGVGDFVAIAQYASLEPDYDVHGTSNLEYVCDRAYAAMQMSCEKTGSVDFDDMVYVPVANKWARPIYDLVVIDEAQDMNASQLMLAQGVASGRVCVVGDDRQAIYGFRGADSGSIDRLKDELGAVELGLTTTYRCPRLVVDIAREVVSDFVCASDAPMGLVESTTEAKLLECATPGDFVLSRKNAPLARICLALLRAGKRAKVEGRDIGAQLAGIARKIAGKLARELPDFLAALESWHDREHAAASAVGGDRGDRRASFATDVRETLEALSDGATGVADILARIDELFSDIAEQGPNGYIVLSSVHKAKGLERERVWVLCETFNDKNTEERNLWYVAVTRSKGALYKVGEAA